MLDISAYQKGSVITGKASLREGKTKPPSQFIEADLIDIMDDIGRYAHIGTNDLAILREKNSAGTGKAGIGTARTRGEIIKKLFDGGFFLKEKIKGKKIPIVIPSEKAMYLYQKLGECGVAKALNSPEMTAKWEAGLNKIELGEITIEQFMSKMEAFIAQMTADVLANPTNTQYGKIESDIERHPKHGEICPKCKKGHLITFKVTDETKKSFGCRYVRCDQRGKCDFFGEFIK